MSATQVLEKASSCFICGQQFSFSELNDHERLCLENIKANDVQYTRQQNEEVASSISSRPESFSLSNHSASSNESYEKRYLRCYICGADVPTYLKGIHEKSCKKNWESGLLNVDRKTNVRADMFRSLSRSSSRSDINADNPKSGGLRKAKSSTLYRRGSSNSALSTSNDDLRTTAKNSKSTSNLSKSQNFSTSQTELTKQVDLYLDLDDPDDTDSSSSVRNLKVATSTPKSKSKLINKTKSLQDISKKTNGISPASSLRSLTSPTPPHSPSPKQRSGSNNPQYVVCHLCGKLYSQHSIVIHIKQCERTRALQKNIGTNVDYKIKSRSLADLSKGKTLTPRVNSISNLATPKNTRNTKPPSTSNGRARPKSAIISSSTSMDNLSIRSRKGSATSNTIKPRQKTEDFAISRPLSEDIRTPGSQSNLSTSPGLQKCYLCGQLYGTRSLPIHQKQCYVKQERIKEEESAGKNKRKKKKDIKILPFGRANSNEKTTPSSPASLRDETSPLFTRRPQSMPSTAHLFSMANGLLTRTGTHAQNGVRKEISGTHERNGSLSSSLSSETDPQSPRSPSSPISVKDLMMTCSHCGCQCEPFTMAIHEKVCRNSTPEIIIDDITDMSEYLTANGVKNNNGEKITNGGLIHCDGCDGNFCSSEIFQHRINCRTSIL